MTNIKKIRSELTIKATAELEEEVLKELETSDPEKAKALETLRLEKRRLQIELEQLKNG